jgi:hypothetical protein
MQAAQVVGRYWVDGQAAGAAECGPAWCVVDRWGGGGGGCVSSGHLGSVHALGRFCGQAPGSGCLLDLCFRVKSWKGQQPALHAVVQQVVQQPLSHSLAHAASGVVRHWPAGQGSGAARRRVGMGVKRGGHDKHTRLAMKASGRVCLADGRACSSPPEHCPATGRLVKHTTIPHASRWLPAVMQPLTDASCTSRRPVLARRTGCRGCRVCTGMVFGRQVVVVVVGGGGCVSCGHLGSVHALGRFCGQAPGSGCLLVLGFRVKS